MAGRSALEEHAGVPGQEFAVSPLSEDGNTGNVASAGRRSFRRRLATSILILVYLGGLAAPWLYARWKDHRTGQYRVGCIEARDTRAWGELDKISELWLASAE